MTSLMANVDHSGPVPVVIVDRGHGDGPERLTMDDLRAIAATFTPEIRAYVEKRCEEAEFAHTLYMGLEYGK